MTLDRKLTFDLSRSLDIISSAHHKAGRDLYNVIDWRGEHRGQIALTREERDALNPILPHPSPSEGEPTEVMVKAAMSELPHGTRKSHVAHALRAALRSASIPPSGVAVKPLGADWSYMPSYGDLDWGPVVQAVAEAIYADRTFDIGLDPSRHIGHQMVPSINFNSLNRIISAFVRSVLLPSPAGAEARAEALEAAAGVADEHGPDRPGDPYQMGYATACKSIATAIRNLIPTLQGSQR